MKLRILGNSIRLRLTRADVALFSRSGRVEETLEYGTESTQRLTYGLESSISGAVSLDVEPNRITVRAPRSVVNDWIETDRVGFEAMCASGGGNPISVLVEKDFQCSHGAADDPNRYPNPHEAVREKHNCG